MKKISLNKYLLTAILLIALFATFAFSGAMHCFADFSGGFIEVFGSGKMEADPNTAQIILSVSTLSSTLRDGQNEIMNTIDCIENSVKEIDENCEVEVYNSITQPVRENGTQEYRLTYWLALKTSCLNCVDALIEKAEECGAINHQNISYELDNFDQLYDEAITIAKNNAFSKAKAINPNISEIELFEVSVFNYSNDSKIVIEACVRIKYEVENVEAISNENIEPFNAEDENNQTLVSESTLTQEQDDLEESTLNEIETNELSSNSQSQLENPSATPTQNEEQQNSINENQNISANEPDEKIDSPVNDERDVIDEENQNIETNETENLSTSSLKNSESSNEELRTIKHINHQTTSDTQESGEVEVSPKVYS